MSDNDDLVWISLDVMRGGQVSGFRGRMEAADLEAILAGVYTAPFVTLYNVHGLESVWNEAERRTKLKLTVYGRHGLVRGFKGSVHLRPDQISTIAPLHDCKGLLDSEDRFRDED